MCVEIDDANDRSGYEQMAEEQTGRLNPRRAAMARAWDEGRAALQKELMRSWSMYDQGPTTPNPYRESGE